MSTNTNGLRIGVVGLGVMGGGMAVALADRGRSLSVFDVSPGAADAVAAEAGQLRTLDSARSVAEKSDLVITCVYGPLDAEAALLDPETGVVAGLQPGAICIDCTTNTLDITERIEYACNAKGARFLASPVTGRPPRMTMMMGGDRSAFDDAQEALADIATKTVFLGTAAAACVAKHINQYLAYANMLIACEGLVAAAKAGVPLDELAAVLEGGSCNSAMLPFALSEALKRDAPIAPAALRLVAKDVRLSRQSLDALGVTSGVLARVDEMYATAEMTLAQEPFPVLLQSVARHYGVDPATAYGER